MEDENLRCYSGLRTATPTTMHSSPMKVQLRACRKDDQDFLFHLYSSTRLEEIAPFGWPQAQQDAFLRMQFAAQQRWYEMSYADAEHQIIEHDGASIGRIMVLRAPERVLLVDISLLPEFRGRGIGGGLLKELIEECGRRNSRLRLQVARNNPALRLYTRLGFTPVGEDPMYIQMEKPPAV